MTKRRFTPSLFANRLIPRPPFAWGLVISICKLFNSMIINLGKLLFRMKQVQKSNRFNLTAFEHFLSVVVNWV